MLKTYFKKRNNLEITKILFIFFFLYNSLQVIQYVIDKYSYQYEDWLINYSNGFVRRGFAGEIFLKFSTLLNINLQSIVLFFLIFLLILFYKKSYDFISTIRLPKLYIFLLFSPFFYFFYIVNHNSGVRKEFLLYLFFIFLLDKNNLNLSNKRYWLYSSFFLILILIHEGLVFYLPFYLLFLIINFDKKNFFNLFCNAIFVSLLSVLITVLSIKFNGSEEHVVKICESLKTYVKDSCINGGAINHLKDELKTSIIYLFGEHNFGSIFQWIIITVYSYSPIIFILYYSSFKKNFYLNKKFNLEAKSFTLIFLFISFISILPLFVIAFDWGRWLSIYYHLTAFFLLYFIKNKIIILQNNFLENFFKKNCSKKIFIILLIFYSTFITPTVFDKSSNENLNPYKLNYFEIISKVVKK